MAGGGRVSPPSSLAEVQKTGAQNVSRQPEMPRSSRGSTRRGGDPFSLGLAEQKILGRRFLAGVGELPYCPGGRWRRLGGVSYRRC